MSKKKQSEISTIIEIVPIYGSVKYKVDEDGSKFNHNRWWSEIDKYSIRMIPMLVQRIFKGNGLYVLGKKCGFYLSNIGPYAIRYETEYSTNQLPVGGFMLCRFDKDEKERIKVYI